VILGCPFCKLHEQLAFTGSHRGERKDVEVGGVTSVCLVERVVAGQGDQVKRKEVQNWYSRQRLL
jgi:hypothetical protein